MSVTIVLSKEYVYPVAAIASTCWLTFWQTIKVGGARKRAGIPYPYVYADKAEVAANQEANVFNCTQRAHQNTLEYFPIVVASTVVASLKHPLIAASLCGLFTASRVVYTIGYSTGDPAKRNLFGSAMFSSLGWLALLGTSAWTVVELFRETL
ncbi:membrane-associated glutathione metabolism protein [Wolfiporia cocos MD-104 SS10]|uniref:Membrane-associated glutathione metabolism protein n=1 Tax=Wolfiporia cocos (strain MD-104) TaxID=742152 RepID=A0A2H3IWD9_WOLCO|nr:membrane-associated glutathione metabolism protein [Wolfiporia cocos MD-104 SS10]